MESHTTVPVDLLDEAPEELNPVLLAVPGRVISFAAQDGQEPAPGLNEATALADRLEGAVESDFECSDRSPKDACARRRCDACSLPRHWTDGAASPRTRSRAEHIESPGIRILGRFDLCVVASSRGHRSLWE